ncbi:Uncharacterized protein APZ42_033152 [Daphnia magna]|uniref:Uncharacterized protein n=1 Tax=Daphnia magna TaxID=35525 RepID=A0A164LEA3_9CRUS|nr:Uncharacterized protein APZ42_033152 [Daphnia magna]
MYVTLVIRNLDFGIEFKDQRKKIRDSSLAMTLCLNSGGIKKNHLYPAVPANNICILATEDTVVSSTSSSPGDLKLAEPFTDP